MARDRQGCDGSGLARIALEENDTRACGDLLTRALARYPDFPEARALLEVVKGLPASDGAKRSAPPSSAIRADRLRIPAESREALLARADATLVFAQPRGPRTEAVVARAAKLSRVAAAMLARAGLGPLRHAVIEGAAETTSLRADDAALLTRSIATRSRDCDRASGARVGQLPLRAGVSTTLDARPALGRDLRGLLGELLKLDHITGGLIVAPDGLVIAAELPREIQAGPLSALAATLGRELELRGPQLRRGTFPMAQFTSATGAAFLGSTRVGFIVLLGECSADWDAIRAALRTAVGTVHRAWAG